MKLTKQEREVLRLADELIMALDNFMGNLKVVALLRTLRQSRTRPSRRKGGANDSYRLEAE